MHIKLLKNDQDHTEALQRINDLWEAKPGTPEHDTLDLLSFLVETYEKERHVVNPHEGSTLESLFEELGELEEVKKAAIESAMIVNEVRIAAVREILIEGLIDAKTRDMLALSITAARKALEALGVPREEQP